MFHKGLRSGRLCVLEGEEEEVKGLASHPGPAMHKIKEGIFQAISEMFG